MKKLITLAIIILGINMNAQITTVNKLKIKDPIYQSSPTQTLTWNPSTQEVGYTSSSGGGVPEAPYGGFSYARNNGNWLMFKDKPTLTDILNNNNGNPSQGVIWLQDGSGSVNYTSTSVVQLIGPTGSGLNSSLNTQTLRFTDNVNNWTAYENNKITVVNTGTLPFYTIEITYPTDKNTGTYIFATRDDIAITNNTTSALDSTTLNTLYPTATLGKRVQCPMISGGGIIYEKTSIGWVQYTMTLVTP